MISSALHPLDVLSSTFPQVEETAEVFPVSLDWREADLADEALPLRVEVVLPRQLIEVALQEERVRQNLLHLILTFWTTTIS